MNGNPAGGERDPAERRTSGSPGAREVMAAERFGPLAVRRMTKADGRALIAYERVDRSREDSGEAGGRGARA